MIRFLCAAFLLLTGLVGPVLASDFKPALLLDVGGKQDKSFNEAAFNGADKFAKSANTEVTTVEIGKPDERAGAVAKAVSAGLNPIIAVGYGYAPAIAEAAVAHPDVSFVIIDSVVDQPNVTSIIFKEQEGSYLAGVLAGLASKSGTVGFVGGMDIALISRFACGFTGGVKSVKPQATVLTDMIGDTDEAWSSPDKADELAKAQIAKGADVVFHAAGGSGVGALKAAAEAGVLGIGVDSNQNGLFPGKVLTSMLKHVGIATFDALTDAQDGKLEPGLRNLGLAEGAVGLAMDKNNEALVTQEMNDAVKRAQSAIESGAVYVHDFVSDNSCPY